MRHCSCYTSTISPVCGSNEVTYLSACFAGCSRLADPDSPSGLSPVSASSPRGASLIVPV